MPLRALARRALPDRPSSRVRATSSSGPGSRATDTSSARWSARSWRTSRSTEARATTSACSGSTASDHAYPSSRGRGGTGRHAGFRCRCCEELGGSSPSARICARPESASAEFRSREVKDGRYDCSVTGDVRAVDASSRRRGGKPSLACFRPRGPPARRLARTAAASTSSPVAVRTSSAVKLPSTRNAVESGRRVYVPSAEPDEERGPEHHDPYCHGARVGPPSDGQRRKVRFADAKDFSAMNHARWPRTAGTQGAVVMSRFSFGDASFPVGPRDAHRQRGGTRPRSRWSRCSPPHRRTRVVLQRLGLRRPDGVRDGDHRLARVPRATRARGVDGHHGCAGLLDLGELWYAIFKPQTYPSMADAGYIAFYGLLYVGVVLLLRSRVRSSAGRSGSTVRRPRWRRQPSARPSSSTSSSRTRTDRPDGRHQPRLPTGRRPAALGRLRRVLAHPLEARPTLAPPRARHPRDHRGRRHLPLQSSNGTYVEGASGRHPLADGHAARGDGRLAPGPHERRVRGRGSAAPRGPGGVRHPRDRDPRLRPLRALQRPRDRPCVGNARCW